MSKFKLYPLHTINAIILSMILLLCNLAINLRRDPTHKFHLNRVQTESSVRRLQKFKQQSFKWKDQVTSRTPLSSSLVLISNNNLISVDIFRFPWVIAVLKYFPNYLQGYLNRSHWIRRRNKVNDGNGLRFW